MTETETTNDSGGDNRNSAGKRIAGLIALVSVIVAAFFFLRYAGVDLHDVRRWLGSVGDRWWAPVVFIVLYAVFNTVLLPATALTLTAGVVWGWLLGGVWVLVASTIGSAVPYLLARSGAPWVEKILKDKAGPIYRALEREGFLTLLLMRLVPIVPYNLLNYAAGLAGIRVRDYLLATFLGTIPGIFIFTYLASSIAAGVVSPRQAFVRILIAGSLLGALAVVSRFFAAKVKARLAR